MHAPFEVALLSPANLQLRGLWPESGCTLQCFCAAASKTGCGALTACLSSRTDEIHELHKREQELGIKPDPDLLAFMKASAKRGKRHSIMTDYVMRILGLEVRSSVGASPRILLQLDLQYASAAQLLQATGACMLGCEFGHMLLGSPPCL